MTTSGNGGGGSSTTSFLPMMPPNKDSNGLELMANGDVEVETET
jgi:hypothetical protein